MVRHVLYENYVTIPWLSRTVPSPYLFVMRCSESIPRFQLNVKARREFKSHPGITQILQILNFKVALKITFTIHFSSPIRSPRVSTFNLIHPTNQKRLSISVIFNRWFYRALKSILNKIYFAFSRKICEVSLLNFDCSTKWSMMQYQLWLRLNDIIVYNKVTTQRSGLKYSCFPNNWLWLMTHRSQEVVRSMFNGIQCSVSFSF